MTKRKRFHYDPLILGVPPILSPPTMPPLTCVQFRTEYRPLIIGALRGLLAENVWNTDESTEVDQSITNIHHLLTLFAIGDCPPEGAHVTCFIGEIKQYFGTTAPPGSVAMDGRWRPREDYPAAFWDVIPDDYKFIDVAPFGNDRGTAFNLPQGDYFRLPNMARKFPIGAGEIGSQGEPPLDIYGAVPLHTIEQGDYGGASEVAITIEEMPAHEHGLLQWNSGANTVRNIPFETNRSVENTSNSTAPDTQAAGGGQAHNNIPEYVAMNYCIVYDCEEFGVTIMTPFRIRQNPENPCLMEQSFDEGVSWVAAFDYSLCDVFGANISTNIYFDNAITIFNEIINDYDGTAVSIDPILEYGDENDGFRNDALCTALYLYFSAVGTLAAEAKAQGYFDEADKWSDVKQLAAAFGGVLGAGVVTRVLAGTILAGLVPIMPTLAIAMGGLVTVASVLQALNETIAESIDWDDPQLAWEAACCVAGELAGATITESAFKFAISDCFNVASGDVAFYLALLDIWNSNSDAYIVFLKIWATIIPGAIGGIEMPCDCAACEDFSFEGATLPANTSAGANASFVANTGIRGNDFATDNSTAIWTSPIGVVDFTKVSFEFQSSVAVNQSRILQVRSGGAVVHQDSVNPGVGSSEGRTTLTWNINESGDEIRVILQPGQEAHPNWIYGLQICYGV